MKSVSRIAMNIIAAEGGNILDDLYRFYNDGKWIVSVARKLSSVFVLMSQKVSNYSVYIPKVEECIGYLKAATLDEFGTDSCVKELGRYLSDMKKKHSEWEKAESNEKASKSEEYMSVVSVAKNYASSFMDSCANVLRNRYIDDESNVRNLLDVIHSAGNDVLNEGAGNQ